MEDPVEMDDQCTYEREAIIQWMKEHSNESPLTHKAMSHTMRPNSQLKLKIQQFLNNRKSNNALNIFVKNIQDKSFILHMNENDKVLQLKQKIKDLTGIAEIEQRLIYMAKQLNVDSNTLKDYNIKNNCTIHLLLRLRGGL